MKSLPLHILAAVSRAHTPEHFRRLRIINNRMPDHIRAHGYIGGTVSDALNASIFRCDADHWRNEGQESTAVTYERAAARILARYAP